jgi:DNA invertase Pin-like site-specific DNA recombinase
MHSRCTVGGASTPVDVRCFAAGETAITEPMPRGQPPIVWTSVDGRRVVDPEEAEQVYSLYRAVADGRSARQAATMLGWSHTQALRVLRRREYVDGEAPIISETLWQDARTQLAKGRPRNQTH